MKLGPYVALFCLALTGCGYIGDLALRSVEAVDHYDRMEILKPSNDVVAHETVLRVEFTSRTDLAKYTDRGDYNLGAWADFCKPVDRPHQIFMSFLNVYWRGLEIHGNGHPVGVNGEGTGEPIIYYTFLSVARNSVTPSNPPEIAFDLRKQPEDVCFRLRGGNEAGGFSSNSVTIPKAVIEKALQNAPASSN